MPLTVSQIAALLGSNTPLEAPSTVITELLTDSRSLLEPGSTLFFALRTPSGDGHKYIRSLYDKGVRAFVVETLPADVAFMPGADFLVVASPLEALRTLAAEARAQLSDTTVIAITGSRGKTTVKEWIYRLLSPVRNVGRSPRSYNSQIGVPLSLWNVPVSSSVAIIEAGISRSGEMQPLASLIRPDVVVFTNIGAPHSSGFSSLLDKAREKALLAAGAQQVVYCADDEIVASVLPDGPERVAWTTRSTPGAALQLTPTTTADGRATSVEFSWREGKIAGSFTLPFTTSRDLENAFHALTVLLLFGADAAAVETAMPLLRPVHTRLNVVEGACDSLFIHDRFTNDLSSLRLALDFMKRRAIPSHPLTLILGDMDPGRESAADTYAAALSLAEASGVSRVIGIGHDISSFVASTGGQILTYPTVAEFLKAQSPYAFRSELVLVKGSPDQPLAEVGRMLEKRRNETVLEINLDAVVDNFNFFRSFIRPTTGIVCMIKASGYGAGSHELARTLQSQGASYLAVAVHDEGADLRQAGITMPIIVLNPAVDDLSTIFAHRLEPEIYSIDFLRSLIAEAQRLGIRHYPVHIKIDSGMHRLGFRLDTLPEVIGLLRSQDAVVPASIFSHLCAADDPAEDDYTREQFDYFDRCSAMLLGAFPERRILRHILNSTGITRFPEHQYDMVRLGIGLYGVRTMHDGSQDALRPVSALRTSIISLKHWPAGTTIGYNRRGRLERDSVIATVPVGYADGLNRHLGYGNARFNVDGVMCPTIGSICMDACMIDVTDVADVHTGERVEIFGDTIPVEALSDALGTIPYEVLTSISQRVKRIYYRE